MDPAAVAMSPETFEQRLQAACDAYNSNRLLKSSALLLALRADLQNAPAPDGPRLTTALDRNPKVRDMEAEMADVRRIYDAMRQTEGWVNCYAGTCTRVDYRPESDQVSHSMRAQGVIHAPLRNVAALLNEPDLFPSVFWFMTRVKVLASPGRFRRAADMTIFAPPPLYNRHVRIFGYAVDGLDEEGCVLIVSRDLRESDGITVRPEDDAALRRVVRAKVNYSMFELKPISPGITKVCLIANANPDLSFIPMTLVNWGSRFVMRFALRVLESRARNISSLPHAERLSDPVYEFIDQRLLAYWITRGYTEDQYRLGGLDTDNISDDFDDSNPESSRSSSVLSYISMSSFSSSKSLSMRWWGSGRS